MTLVKSAPTEVLTGSFGTEPCTALEQRIAITADRCVLPGHGNLSALSATPVGGEAFLASPSPSQQLRALPAVGFGGLSNVDANQSLLALTPVTQRLKGLYKLSFPGGE